MECLLEIGQCCLNVSLLFFWFDVSKSPITVKKKCSVNDNLYIRKINIIINYSYTSFHNFTYFMMPSIVDFVVEV